MGKHFPANLVCLVGSVPGMNDAVGECKGLSRKALGRVSNSHPHWLIASVAETRQACPLATKAG